MTILDEVLFEEYERMKNMYAAMRAEMELLPKGYVSRKNIRGRQYCYLQKREGSKIVSAFIRAEDIPKVSQGISRRKQLEASLRELEEGMKKIEKVIR